MCISCRNVMGQKIRDAVDAYILFEQETSAIYPFGVFDPTNEQRQKIVEVCASDDTEAVHEACTKILGVNRE